MIKSLTGFVADARWFGDKGRDFEISGVREIQLADGVTTMLVTIAYADGGTDLYQVPISSYDEPADRIGHALIGEWDDLFHYDAVHDRPGGAVTGAAERADADGAGDGELAALAAEPAGGREVVRDGLQGVGLHRRSSVGDEPSRGVSRAGRRNQ